MRDKVKWKSMKAKLAVFVCAAASALVSFGAIRAVTPVALDGKPGGTLSKRIIGDAVHPTAEGYRIWWDNMGPLVKEIVGK